MSPKSIRGRQKEKSERFKYEKNVLFLALKMARLHDKEIGTSNLYPKAQYSANNLKEFGSGLIQHSLQRGKQLC